MKSDLYSAFGNEVRVKLLMCLAQKTKTVSELIATCGLAQSAVSQHLSKLKAAGLVKTQKQGKEVQYSLKSNNIAKICMLLISLERETV